MTVTLRAALVQDLKARFLPLVLASGFVIHPLSDEEKASGAWRLSFPFGYLKRPKGPDLELLEVQFSTRGRRCRFVLHVGVAPPEGADLPWGHFAQSEVSPGGLPESYTLYSRAFMKWFAPAWFGDPHSRAAKAVDRVIALYPEIEAWFATKTVGSHMRRSSYPFPPGTKV
jgi:hypothetical protein